MIFLLYVDDLFVTGEDGLIAATKRKCTRSSHWDMRHTTSKLMCAN